MNHLHTLTTRKLSPVQDIISETLIPPGDMTYPPFPLAVSPIRTTYLDHDHNQSLPERLLDSSISEVLNDSEENDNTGMDFQYAASEARKCKHISWNINILTPRATNSQYRHVYGKVPPEKMDDVGFDSSFSSNSAVYSMSTHTSAYKGNRFPFSRNNNQDYLGHLQSHDHQKTRNAISAASQRDYFQRPSFFHNVRHKDIVFGEVIGKGGFGMVYTGNIHGHPVAIKVVQKRRGSGIHREILQAERLAFTLNLRHENIVIILGMNLCDGLRGDALIVMELAGPQTLQSLLDDNSRVITQSQRLQFALQITKALSYLHGNDVAHLDVKPRNVLLTTENTCKLGDFGSLTRTRTDSPREETEFTQLLGTLPYRAPELMKGCFPTNKADIYSLGITFWQLVTRETPHCGANPHWLIYQVTKGNKRPDYHDTGSDIIEIKYRDHYIACWDADCDLRPQAADVVTSLSTLLQCVCDNGWSDVQRNE